MQRIHMTVSPQSWGLERSNHKDSEHLAAMGLPKAELELRARENTYTWLTRQFDYDLGAFHGFYDPRKKEFALPQTANLIAPFQLIAAFDVPTARDTAGMPPHPHDQLHVDQPLIEPLSEREMDVLRLLSTGLSNPEIGQELFIATSTVRSHLKSIYGKLNVHNRWDAVHRAEELGLL